MRGVRAPQAEIPPIRTKSDTPIKERRARISALSDNGQEKPKE